MKIWLYRHVPKYPWAPVSTFLVLYPWCHCCCRQVASVVSGSVRPHRRQPTRLPHPWDSPGKNTGVGCHFLLQCMKVKSESEVTQLCPTLSDPMDCSLPGTVHGIFQARVLEWGAIAFSDGATGATELFGCCLFRLAIWLAEWVLDSEAGDLGWCPGSATYCLCYVEK